MLTLKKPATMLAVLSALMLAALFIGSSTARAQSGPTTAPDLQSVGNFRPGPNDNNGDPRTFVDFTFDQPAYLTGGNRTGFGLVPADGSDSVFGSDFIPSNQTDPQGDNTITVLFNGNLTPANFARGFVSNATVSSGPQGNEPTNIGQAEPIGDNTSVNPDLRSVRVDCQQNQAFFRFDEPLDQEDVVQNTGGLQLYFNDGTRASAQAVDQTGNPAVLRATFTDLPQGKTLSDAVGGIVTNGTVAGQSPNGPGGQAINQFDEIAPVQQGAGCGTAGGGPGSGGGSGDNGSGGNGSGNGSGGSGGSNDRGTGNGGSDSGGVNTGGQQTGDVIGDINVTGGDNTATQYAGDDTAIGGDQSGDGNSQTISQDEAQAISQENNTTINVVQQSGAGF
jgi:hypothetical protein